MKRFNQKGFTLVEVLAVMIILGIMITIGFGAYSRYQMKAQKDALNVLLDNSASAAEEYFMEHPAATSITLENDGTKEGLVDLQLLENRNNPFSRNGKCTGTVTRYKPGSVDASGNPVNIYDANKDSNSLGMDMLKVELNCGTGHEYCYMYPDKRVCGEDVDIPAPTVIPSPSVVPDPPKTYTLTFDSKGGSAIPEQTIEEGKTATAPSSPIYAGYIFMGWFSDVACTTAYDFSTPMTADKTIYASWKQNYSLGLASKNFNNRATLIIKVKFNKLPSKFLSSGKSVDILGNVPAANNAGLALAVNSNNYVVFRAYNNTSWLTITDLRVGENVAVKGMEDFVINTKTLQTGKWYTIIGIVEEKDNFVSKFDIFDWFKDFHANELVVYINSAEKAKGIGLDLYTIPLIWPPSIIPAIGLSVVDGAVIRSVGISNNEFTYGNNGQLIENGNIEVEGALIFDQSLNDMGDKKGVSAYMNASSLNASNLNSNYNKQAIACYPPTLCQ